jgi:hypothetical protein
MLTLTQIAAIIMLLQAFGVSPDVVSLVQSQISVPQMTLQATGGSSDSVMVSTTTPTSTNIVILPVQQVVAPTAPLKIPLCFIRAILPTKNNYNHIFVNWEINPNATGFLTGHGDVLAHGQLDLMGASSTVYTLTETMDDSAYQTTTTCQATPFYPWL